MSCLPGATAFRTRPRHPLRGDSPERERSMRKVTRTIVLCMAALLAIAGATRTASAVTITWLDMSPTPSGSTVPSGSVFFVPGIGNVTLTYSMPAVMTTTRLTGGVLQAGNLVSGTYTWTNYEAFTTYFTAGPDPLVPELWSVTYTFPLSLPANVVYVGASGMGQTTSFGGGATVVTVNQNGSFLGDWTGGGGPWGPTLFTPGAGTFAMQNSLNGAGGLDPWWNTPLGVVKITDAVGSITIYGSQIRGDGIGFNIGFDIPLATPASSSSWGRLKNLYR